MRKHILFIFAAFTLASCSGIVRQPASVSSCTDFVKSFFEQDLKSGTNHSAIEFAFLNDKEITAFLSKQKNEREEIESDLLLIKKKYQHMDSSQVIAHFKLLRNSCNN